MRVAQLCPGPLSDRQKMLSIMRDGHPAAESDDSYFFSRAFVRARMSVRFDIEFLVSCMIIRERKALLVLSFDK